MSQRVSSLSRPEVGEAVRELRRHPGLFSFEGQGPFIERVPGDVSSAMLGLRPGSVVELLASRGGAGAMTFALQMMARSSGERGILAIIDPAGEFHVPGLSGWGIDPAKVLVVRPSTPGDFCWAIEQCLRCTGVRATWAQVKEGLSERVHRRWQLAAEVGGGVGLFFRPACAQREPAWVDLRLLVTPQPGADKEETRRVRIETLYRRGGRGGSTQVWEIDHAAGHVRVVPEVAASKTAKHSARA